LHKVTQLPETEVFSTAKIRPKHGTQMPECQPSFNKVPMTLTTLYHDITISLLFTIFAFLPPKYSNF